MGNRVRQKREERKKEKGVGTGKEGMKERKGKKRGMK